MVINPYQHNTASGTRKEIDLRAEFDRIIYGDDQTMPHGQMFILRHMRHDTNGYLVPCPTCNTGGTNEGAKNYKCKYCDGEGFLWDEQFVLGYRSDESPSLRYVGKIDSIGEVNSALPYIFLRYDVVDDPGITVHDRILEPTTSIDGEIVSPVVINRRYKIPWLREMRSDNGRVEYVKVRVVETAL